MSPEERIQEILADATQPVIDLPKTATTNTPPTAAEMREAIYRAVYTEPQPPKIYVHPEGWRRYAAGECICAWDMLLVVPCPIHPDIRST